MDSPHGCCWSRSITFPRIWKVGIQIVLNGASSYLSSTLLRLFFYNLNFLLFWFLGLEWEDSSSYFLDVYVQHPEFIHRVTSLPLKIRAKSRSNMINISSFALQTQRAQALDCVTAGQWLTPHHQQVMKAKPQKWGQTLQLETSFTGFSANAFYVTFASSHIWVAVFQCLWDQSLFTNS